MDLDLLKSIVETPGAPGHESPIRNVIRTKIEPFVDEIHTDPIGNLIARKKGDGPTVMLAAHMDEISLITTHVDDKGFIRFSTLGGFDPETLVNQRMWVHGKKNLPGVIGGKPVHTQTDDQKKSKTKLKDLFIDTGLPAETVKEQVPDGTVVTRMGDLMELGGNLTGKSLDNRISVYILIEALKNAQQSNADLYAVFTAQEEVGIRGARVAAQRIQPNIGIALDTTIANDLPGSGDHEACTTLGEGTGIKVMDKSIICTPSLVDYLEKLAGKREIKHQREVLTAGGTDTSGMQYLVGIGSYVSCISTPTRYIHSMVETVSKTDVEAGISLATAVIEHIGDFEPEPASAE
ncbi:MAG: M42 family metallopeptidase [Balneolaceae bacterium]